ncbi:MAG: FtsX-like permease family protein [Candidatus Bathyarchaeia archaeon]
MLFLLALLCVLALFFLSIKYAVYAMLVLLSVVAATGGFVLFDGDLTKLISTLMIYAVLVAPFLAVYGEYASRMDMNSAQGFALVAAMIPLTIALTANEFLRGASTIVLFQLAKRFLKSRRLRYSLSLLSMIVFAAGVTSLSFNLSFPVLALLCSIVVCGMALTMMGNVYERRREITSLATVGMNPDHLSAIFFAEAIIMGFLGGGVGYSTGLYIFVLSSLPVTMFEISTGWMVSVILLCVSLAIVSTALPAMKASMLATPSLVKRWWQEARPFTGWLPTWTFNIPVKVTKDNAESLITFFLGYAAMLEGFSYGSIERVESIQVLRPECLREKVWKLKFRYLFNEGGDRSITTENELRVDVKTSTTDFTVKVVAFQNVGNIHEWLERIASTYRKLALEWTTETASSYVNSPSSHQPSERV